MKKILCIGVAAVLALGIVSLSGCGKKETPVETEAPTTTTEATTTTETTTEKVTYKTLYSSKLDTLIDEKGGVNCGRLVDMDADGTPEMIVFYGSAPSITAEIFTIKDEKAVSIYDKTFTGLRFFVSDASYEAWINESISPTALVLFDSKDEWEQEVIYAVTVSGGAASTEEVKADAEGELDFPDFESCKCTINGETVSGSDYEVERDRLSTGADIINPTASDLDSLREALK